MEAEISFVLSRWASVPPARPFDQHLRHLVANLLGVGLEMRQNLQRNSVLAVKKSKQEVLRADVVVAQAQRLGERVGERVLCLRRERDVALGQPIADADDLNDLRAGAL